jgi:hypothetical protein
MEISEQNELPPSHHQSPRDAQVSDKGHSPDEPATPDYTAVSNPLVADHATYISISGRLRYLGHSSNWSFTQQVLEMVHQSPLAKHLPRNAMYVEGDAYKLPFDQPFALTQSDISGLPSLDLSLYYVHSVKFRTNPLFYLFDEEEFVASLRQFYKAPLAYAQEKPLWFIHYLVIMSFGKALLTKIQTGESHDAASVGSNLLIRALRLLPDITYLCSEPIEATEILCAISLFLQCIDHRCAAHSYVSRLRSPRLHH